MCSSGWGKFWKELLLVTDVSITWAEVIFRVGKWINDHVYYIHFFSLCSLSLTINLHYGLLRLRHLAQIACFIDNKWSESCKWTSWVILLGKFLHGKSSNNDIWKHITQFVVLAFVLSYRIPCLFCLTARTKLNVSDVSSKKISRTLLPTQLKCSFTMSSLLNDSP